MNDLEQLDELNGMAGVKRASEESEAEGAPEDQKSADESTGDAVAMKRQRLQNPSGQGSSWSGGRGVGEKRPSNADGAWEGNAAKISRNATSVPSSENNVSQDVLQLAIKGKDGSLVHLTIAKQARLQKLMEEYCKSQGVEWRHKRHEIRFIFAGKSVRETQTAGELKMQGGDVIEARHGTHDANVGSIPPCYSGIYHERCLACACARMEYGVVDQHSNQ
jgi:hypothetical protein